MAGSALYISIYSIETTPKWAGKFKAIGSWNSYSTHGHAFPLMNNVIIIKKRKGIGVKVQN